MASAHPLIDHEEIRAWADERGARPACVRRTGGKGDAGMIRLDFPGFSGAQSLAPLPWPKWFKAFDDNNLALLVQDRTARGQQSNFNKLVSRESVAAESTRQGGRKQAGSRAGAGRKAAGRTTKGSRSRSTSRRTSTSARSGSRAAATNGSSRRPTAARSRKSGSSRAAGGSRKRSRAGAGQNKKRR